ncbi:hypothetical protein [Afipia broomeae]|uniref:Uncharacterized protein n=1 Tax=Afipia broomeae ATCC 49717 TaxID=883078 RepID=K8PKP1_9BRAD|nr:hypothetical protein [Afipia broomeae]EKS41314.1 hypothetical protein HMPREF9695_00406 [Afipia broomeae ATCC 49717]
MNKLVAASIGNAVKIKLIDDKTVRIAAEVKEAERHARRNGIVRNILERNRLSKKAYGALCRLDLAATKLTQTAPTTAAGLVAKAGVAKLVDGYSEGFSEEIEKELASDVLRVLAPGTTSRIMADLAISQDRRESSPVLQAVLSYRRALRAEAKARRALSKLTEKYPDLKDTRPAVAAGIREGKPVYVRCLADWNALYGHEHDEQWAKFSRALDEARPAHKLARQRTGIKKAENTFYEARRATARSFEDLCRLKPENVVDLRAFAGVIVRHMKKEAGDSISNVYPYSRNSDYQEWKDRRHSAMFTALRVLGGFAR